MPFTLKWRSSYRRGPRFAAMRWSPAGLFDIRPQEHAGTYDAIVAPTDRFCRDHLNDEYRELPRAMTAGRCKPAWSDNAAVHESDAAKRIERAVGRSRFYDSEAHFPIGYLHHRVAKWAVDTVRSASEDFSRAIKEEDRFAAQGFDFTLS